MDTCIFCIMETANSTAWFHVRIDPDGGGNPVRGMTPDAYRDVTGMTVAAETMNIPVPPGNPSCRMLAYAVQWGYEVSINNQPRKPVAITTLDGLPLCELHSRTHYNERLMNKRRGQ